MVLSDILKELGVPEEKVNEIVFINNWNAVRDSLLDLIRLMIRLGIKRHGRDNFGRQQMLNGLLGTMMCLRKYGLPVIVETEGDDSDSEGGQESVDVSGGEGQVEEEGVAEGEEEVEEEVAEEKEVVEEVGVEGEGEGKGKGEGVVEEVVTVEEEVVAVGEEVVAEPMEGLVGIDDVVAEVGQGEGIRVDEGQGKGEVVGVEVQGPRVGQVGVRVEVDLGEEEVSRGSEGFLVRGVDSGSEDVGEGGVSEGEGEVTEIREGVDEVVVEELGEGIIGELVEEVTIEAGAEMIVVASNELGEVVVEEVVRELGREVAGVVVGEAGQGEVFIPGRLIVLDEAVQVGAGFFEGRTSIGVDTRELQRQVRHNRAWVNIPGLGDVRVRYPSTVPFYQTPSGFISPVEITLSLEIFYVPLGGTGSGTSSSPSSGAPAPST